MKIPAQLASRSNPIPPSSLAPAGLWRVFFQLRLTIRRALHPLIASLRLPVPILRRQIVFPLFLLSAGLAFVQPCAATPFGWDFTGSLNYKRSWQKATLLPSGKVLVAGGIDVTGLPTPLASAELYDRTIGKWTVTGSLNVGRWTHTLTLLSDGNVLVAGGKDASHDAFASAELYDPATGTWSFTGSLNLNRSGHTATLLANGKVLVFGGDNDLGTAELYDPATGTWSFTGSLNTARGAPATLLANGMVLVAGGQNNLASAELYDPATGLWTFTGPLNKGGVEHRSTLLASGQVLVAGGIAGADFKRCELYDPATGTWTLTGSLNKSRLGGHSATLLPDGAVLVEGSSSTSDSATAELYDPATGLWTFTGSLNRGRYIHTATLLATGEVLVAGGWDDHFNALASAELYNSETVPASKVIGRGSVEAQGDQATFSFHATQTEDRPNGSLSYGDPVAGISISKARISSLTSAGSNAELGGRATLSDGTRVTFDVSVTDNGDGSTDIFTISLSNGYSAGGTLTSGDIQIQ